MTVALATRAPFHLEATVRVLQRRPAQLVDVWERDRYLRVLALPALALPVLASSSLALVEVRNHGSIDRPDVRLRIRAGDDSPAAHRAARATMRRMLGLDLDPAPLRRIVESQLAMRTTAIALRGMRPPRFESLFESFASIVPFQQLSIEAGTAIVARLVGKLGLRIDHEGRAFHAFPTASRCARARLDVLQNCGLSATKSQTLRGVARAIESGELSEAALAAMPIPAALDRLMELPGIGPWSAALVLLRGLGRLEVFPPGDVGAARGLRNLLRLGAREPLEPVIARFGEHRGYLYFCALGGWLLEKGLIHAAALPA